MVLKTVTCLCLLTELFVTYQKDSVNGKSERQAGSSSKKRENTDGSSGRETQSDDALG